MEAEYSKRVYQGVRVKHTVKDLLAEKRSRQTGIPRFTGVSAPQSSFVQMTGSHMLSGYYSVRRPCISEGDYCLSSKPLSTDVYPSTLTGKPLACDPAPMSGYQSLLDGYYPETFSDYRGAALSGGGSNILSSSSLSSLLPPFPGDTSNFVLQRESWETDVVDAVEGLSVDCLVPAPVPSSLAGSEPSNLGQYRSTQRGVCAPTSQFYPLHTLDDGHYPSVFQTTPSGLMCPAYMAVSSEASTKALSSAEAENVLPLLNDTLQWVKDDAGGGPWSQYEIRRVF